MTENRWWPEGLDGRRACTGTWLDPCGHVLSRAPPGVLTDKKNVLTTRKHSVLTTKVFLFCFGFWFVTCILGQTWQCLGLMRARCSESALAVLGECSFGTKSGQPHARQVLGTLCHLSCPNHWGFSKLRGKIRTSHIIFITHALQILIFFKCVLFQSVATHSHIKFFFTLNILRANSRYDCY